jgi:hypothetical protein
MDRILGAIGSRIHIGSRAANRIAGGDRQRAADQDESDKFPNHDRSLFDLRNDHGCQGTGLSSAKTPILALATVHRVIGAIGDRIHVASGAANRVARRSDECRADQRDGEDFLEHDKSPILDGVTNAVGRERLHCAFVIHLRVIGEARSDRDGGRDMRMRIVVFEEEVFGLVIEQ